MKNSRFRFFKPLLWAFVLSLASMILIFSELISMYANNINDFWFDFSVLIGPTTLLAVIPSLALFAILSILYAILKRFKKENLYYIFFAITSLGFITCYIHANFLSSMLPSLDGTEFDWSSTPANISSILVIIILVIGLVALLKIYKPEKTASIVSYINLAILAMLGVSLLTTLTTTDVFTSKEIIAESSTKNLNLVSENENFFILMLDAVDAKTFEKAMSNDSTDTKELKDFSYFPDSLSGYPFTRDSVPFILSGIWNKNEKPFEEYSTEAYDNSQFFESLKKNDYKTMNFYDYEFIWRSRKALDFDNIESSGKTIKKRHFVTQELKYLLFKTLPFPLKRFSHIENMNYNDSKIIATYEPFVWDDTIFYNNTLKKDAEKTANKVFSFIHLEGAHVPLNLNKNVEVIDEGGNYRTKVDATLTIIKAYINYLKKHGAYNNSTIVILADHGFNEDGGIPGRENPLLLIKGNNETHSKMHASEKQISFEDLASAFSELAEGKNSTEIFSGIPTSGRIRNFIYYAFTKEDHMKEQTLDGKAWETEKIKFTGKEFNR